MDAVVKLIELGAELDARDMSDCTPLQNTAHGTYSALAPVPSGVSASPNGSLQVAIALWMPILGIADLCLFPGVGQSVSEETWVIVSSAF